MIMSSGAKTVSSLPFQSGYHLFFLVLMLWLELPVQRSCERRPLSFVPDLCGKDSSYSALSMMLAKGFLKIDILYHIERTLFLVYWNRCFILSDGFSASRAIIQELVQTLGVGDRQGSLACCSPWGRKELDTTEQLN